MTEERRAAPVPKPFGPDTMTAAGARSPSASDEHPTPADTDPNLLDAGADEPASTPSIEDGTAPPSRPANRDASGAARRRGRMLRIPDDEISRPDVSRPEVARPEVARPEVARPEIPRPRAAAAVSADATPSPPVPRAEEPAVLLMPMRIITIGPTSEPPPAPPSRSLEDRIDAALEREDEAVTAVPPAVVELPPPPARADIKPPSRVSLASDELIPIDSEPSEPGPESMEPPSIEPIEEEEEPTPPPHMRARQPTEPEEGEDVAFDEDVPTPAPPAVPLTGSGSGPNEAVAPSKESARAHAASGKHEAVNRSSVPGERFSDPGSELSSEDLVTLETEIPQPKAPVGLPPMRPRLASQPPVPATGKAPQPPQPPLTGLTPKPPLVIVPPHVGTMAPSPAEGSGLRRKGRLWWEDLFNDDYLRTCERLTDEQFAREVDFIEDRLSIERGGAVLDLACGTGRHAIELARRGYEVVGFDLSLAMLARAGDEAQDRDAKLNFVQGDMREMSFEEQFDGVYCWNTSFGYFEEEKNAQVIDRIHRSLKAGGLLLLDVINRDFLIRQSPSLAWFEGDGCVCMDEMTVDFITSRMKVKRTMMLDDGRSREIEYSMRVYSLHELGRILHEHKFKVCEVSGRTATPGVFFGNESPRTIILAEKR